MKAARYILPLFSLAAAYVGFALIDAGLLIGLAYIAAGCITAQVAIDARAAAGKGGAE